MVRETGQKDMTKKDPNNDSPGWDDERVQRLIQHYDSQSDEEAIAEDEAAFDDPSHTVMTIPNELVPAVRAILADYTA